MYAADQIIDIGPGAGTHALSPQDSEEVKKVEGSITGQYLSEKRK